MPELWSTSESFLMGKNFVTNLKVVNDAAERNVKFYTNYVGIITKIVQQRNSLLQAVEKHHGEFEIYLKKIRTLSDFAYYLSLKLNDMNC